MSLFPTLLGGLVREKTPQRPIANGGVSQGGTIWYLRCFDRLRRCSRPALISYAPTAPYDLVRNSVDVSQVLATQLDHHSLPPRHSPCETSPPTFSPPRCSTRLHHRPRPSLHHRCPDRCLVLTLRPSRSKPQREREGPHGVAVLLKKDLTTFHSIRSIV
ncbi:hypothetical protein U1Q18_052282 [Sarracenia purpurea var. burkii]